MGGLDRLTGYLRATADERIVLGYDEIEQITGRLLPTSARRHAQAFWSDRSVYAEAWTRAGFHADTAGLAPEEVAFTRVPGRQEPQPDKAAQAGPAELLAPLTDHLQQSPLHWVVLSVTEIEELIGQPLPAGLRQHPRAWTNPLSRYARAWRKADYRARPAQLAADARVFVHRRASTARIPSPPPGADPIALLIGDGDVHEAGERPAADLYRSQLFSRRRVYAESRGRPWLILSAAHGLVDPDTVVGPSPQAAVDWDAWGRGVVEALAARSGPLQGAVFEVHADPELIIPIVDRLRAAGAALRLPLEAHTPEEQVQWYEQAVAPVEEPAAEAPATSADDEPAAAAEPIPVVRALLGYGARLAATEVQPYFTRDPEANALALSDPFAYLLGVIAERGTDVESEWALPHRLRQRLGHVDPTRLAAEPEALRAAMVRPPRLHDHADAVAADIAAAARRVVQRYGGDPTRLWTEASDDAELGARLDDFPGIGPAKSAAVVELLKRLLRSPLSPFEADAVACDEHVRRVFLRTGLAEHDDTGHVVEAVRRAHAGAPSDLQYPAWEVGRRWCHPTLPNCAGCVLSLDCAKLLQRTHDVRDR
ncbi:MAG: hypothetical protein M3N52_03825 [Actinomycetota bacterium]|nr:hypothetical protein [Actinomycetota bacterium]